MKNTLKNSKNTRFQISVGINSDTKIAGTTFYFNHEVSLMAFIKWLKRNVDYKWYSYILTPSCS